MNKYLKSAANRYEEKFKKEFLINPISKTDGEIITEIIELFKKAEMNDVVAVLKQYKYKKDEEIRDDLLDLNTNFKEKVKRESNHIDIENTEEESTNSKVIIFNDHQETFIKKSYILGGKKVTFVDKETMQEAPAILLNEVDELATKKPMYANTILTYDTEEERDEDHQMLIEQIEN